MDRADLAEAVTAEVLRRLQSPNFASVSQVAVGGDWPGWQTFAPEMSADRCQQALLVQLSPGAMVRLAQGNALDAAECFLLEMLLLGRPVFLAPHALTYHRYRDTAPEALYRQYVASEKMLLSMGIRPLALPPPAAAAKSRLLTEAAAEALIARGETVVSVSSATIITPLAADALKAAHVAVIRQKEEAAPWNWQK